MPLMGYHKYQSKAKKGGKDTGRGRGGGGKKKSDSLLMKGFLPDGTQRIVEIESSAANMTEVWSQMCEKLSLPRREWPFFFVWLFGGISADIMETRKTIKQIVAEYPELRQ